MFTILFIAVMLQAAPQESLDLGRLIQQLEQNNRELQMGRRMWEAAQARPSQESAPPNPIISIGSISPGWFPIPGRGLGMDQQSTISPMVMQDLPFPGKLKLKGEISQKEAEATGRMYEGTRLGLINELKMAYFELFKAEKSIETVETNRELLKQLAEIARARYEVGSGLQQDVIKSELEATMLEARLTMYRQRRDSMKAKISQLINRSPDESLGSVGEIESSELPYSLAQLYGTAEEANSVLAARRAMVDRNAQKLDLAKKQYLPDFNLRVGYMYMGQFDNLWDISVGAQVPLFFWKRERKGVEEASAELRGASNDYEATVQGTYRGIKDAYLSVTTADRLLRLYKEALIPQASSALESSLSAYRVGNLDFLSIINNWTVILNLQLEFYNQLAMRETAIAELERLTGLQLVKTGGAK